MRELGNSDVPLKLVEENLDVPDDAYIELYRRFGILQTPWPWLTPFDKVSDLSRSHVLDLGCGMGRIAVSLLNAGCAVTGVDANPKMLEDAKRLAPNFVAIHSRIEAIALKKRFELILLASLLLCNAPKERRDTILAKAVEHLSPKGVIAFQLYCPNWLCKAEDILFPTQKLVCEHFDHRTQIWRGHIDYFFEDVHFRQRVVTEALMETDIIGFLRPYGLEVLDVVKDSPISFVHFARRQCRRH